MGGRQGGRAAGPTSNGNWGPVTSADVKDNARHGASPVRYPPPLTPRQGVVCVSGGKGGSGEGLREEGEAGEKRRFTRNAILQTYYWGAEVVKVINAL